jgi:hypothetical protein
VSQALKTRDDGLGLMRKVDLVLSYNEREQAVVVLHNLDSTPLALSVVVKVPESSPGFDERVDKLPMHELCVRQAIPRSRRHILDGIGGRCVT